MKFEVGDIIIHKTIECSGEIISIDKCGYYPYEVKWIQRVENDIYGLYGSYGVEQLESLYKLDIKTIRKKTLKDILGEV